MPYPSQINTEQVIKMAREMLETTGIEQLSLQRLAEALGVKAPSLYRYFAGKTELLRAINRVTIQALIEAMTAASEAERDHRQRLVAMFHAYRRFALTYPAAYNLLFNNAMPDVRLDPLEAEHFAVPLQARMEEFVGAEKSLPALRGAWALVHGFIDLELAQQFQRAGDLDSAFKVAIHAYLTGWQEDTNGY